MLISTCRRIIALEFKVRPTTLSKHYISRARIRDNIILQYFRCVRIHLIRYGNYQSEPYAHYYLVYYYTRVIRFEMATVNKKNTRVCFIMKYVRAKWQTIVTNIRLWPLTISINYYYYYLYLQ